MSREKQMSYVITPVGMPDYFFCGAKIGFTRIKGSALQYVSAEVAKMATQLIEANIRKDFPKCKKLVARRSPSQS